MRLSHLTRAPFCARCGQFATVAHHKVEPKGDATLFYNPDNLESLCVACHNAHHSNVSSIGTQGGLKV